MNTALDGILLSDQLRATRHQETFMH